MTTTATSPPKPMSWLVGRSFASASPQAPDEQGHLRDEQRQVQQHLYRHGQHAQAIKGETRYTQCGQGRHKPGVEHVV
ncbi:MAG: hypothetical protein R2857_03885 [Vampirovibrionales bacterium]